MNEWICNVLPVDIPLGELQDKHPELASAINQVSSLAGTPASCGHQELLRTLAETQLADVLKAPRQGSEDVMDGMAFKLGLVHGLLIARALTPQCEAFLKQLKEPNTKEPQ